MAESYTVRRTEHADLDEILDLFTAVAAEGRWIGTEPGFDRAAKRSRTAAGIERDDTLSLVARIGDTLAGSLGTDESAEG